MSANQHEYGVHWVRSGQTTAQPSREIAEELVRAHEAAYGNVNVLMVRTGPDTDWQRADGAKA
jgi:hypothetical protein